MSILLLPSACPPRCRLPDLFQEARRQFKVLRAVENSDSQLGPDGTGLNITYLQVFTWKSIGTGRPTDQTPLLSFHVVADPDDPASTSGDVVGRYAIRNTSSQELIDITKSWLATCTKEHFECSRTLSGQPIATPTPLPTRCLEVRADPMAVGGIRIHLAKQPAVPAVTRL